MSDTQSREYLRSAVMTASPEQLHLMLYDGAIRFASQARDAIVAGQIEKSFELLMRAQRIISEMQNGLCHEVNPELCARTASLYSYVFSRLVDANIQKDLSALDDALRILRMQRDTWSLLVDKVQKARSHPQSDAPVGAPQADSESFSLEG